MAVSKVGFENPIKPNMQFEKFHVDWIDEQAVRFGMGRQGFMRQLLEGLMGYAATKSPKVVDSLIKLAGKPLAITRKPAVEEFLPPPPVRQRPSKIVASELPPPRVVSAPGRVKRVPPMPPSRASKSAPKQATKPTPIKKKGAK